MASDVEDTCYTGTYLGNLISSADFPRLALRASAVIDRVTFNRAAAIVTAGTELATIDLIQMATCEVAEQQLTNETLAANNNGNVGIKSESVGSHSVTYIENADATLSDNDKLKRSAALYLGQTGLMFPGFYTGEYGMTIDAE
jgi:hypothetical protein